MDSLVDVELTDDMASRLPEPYEETDPAAMPACSLPEAMAAVEMYAAGPMFSETNVFRHFVSIPAPYISTRVSSCSTEQRTRREAALDRELEGFESIPNLRNNWLAMDPSAVFKGLNAVRRLDPAVACGSSAETAQE